MCRTSVYEARNNLSSLIKVAERGECVELLRHNKPVAVIIGYEEYGKIKPAENTAMDDLNSWRKKWNISKLKSDYFDKELAFIESNKNREVPDYSKI